MINAKIFYVRTASDIITIQATGMRLTKQRNETIKSASRSHETAFGHTTVNKDEERIVQEDFDLSFYVYESKPVNRRILWFTLNETVYEEITVAFFKAGLWERVWSVGDPFLEVK